MDSTIKVRDDGTDPVSDGLNNSMYHLQMMSEHYNTLAVEMVGSNLTMAMAMSGATKSEKQLSAALAISLAILRAYLEIKRYLVMQSRIRYMTKMAKGDFAYVTAAGEATAMSTASLGALAPVIAMAVASAIAIIAMIYSIPKMESGGVLHDRHIIPLDKIKRGTIRNKIYYITKETIPQIIRSNADYISRSL
jgi:hypothetical protein